MVGRKNKRKYKVFEDRGKERKIITNVSHLFLINLQDQSERYIFWSVYRAFCLLQLFFQVNSVLCAFNLMDLSILCTFCLVDILSHVPSVSWASCLLHLLSYKPSVQCKYCIMDLLSHGPFCIMYLLSHGPSVPCTVYLLSHVPSVPCTCTFCLVDLLSHVPSVLWTSKVIFHLSHVPSVSRRACHRTCI